MPLEFSRIQFVFFNYYRIHYQVEHEGKTHVCERCAMCFVSVEELQTHGNNCHNNDADSAPGDISKSRPSNEESPKSSTSPIQEPEVKCLKCEFTATSRTDMKLVIFSTFSPYNL